MDQDDPMDGSLFRGTEELHHCAARLALTNELIASRICFHSQPEPGVYYRQRYLTLTSVARTCKSLYIPAAKHIWKDINSLTPLIMTMPVDCWEIEGPEDVPLHQRYIRIKRSITAADCDRFHFYAQFVRNFYTGTFHLPDVREDSNIYESLFSVMKGYGETCLFPNLEKLDWSVYLDLTFPSFATLLHSRLQSVWISPKGEQTSLRLIKELISRCPNLRSVTLAASLSDPTTTLSSAISTLGSLTRLRVTSLSTDAYLRLAEHPNLKALSVSDIATVDWAVVERRPPKSLSFPRLEDIDLHMCSIENAIRTFRSMNRPPLRNIKIWIRGSPEPGLSLGSLFQSVNTAQAFETLSHLDLDESWSGDLWKLGVLERSFIPEHLAPLFSFKRLVDVKIELSRSIIMVDSYIQKLAESWPAIERLVLLCTSEAQWDYPRNTIRSLVHFALNCPSLKELTLTCDARDPQLPEKRLSSSISSKLSSLHVRDSPIGNSAMVAAILSDWFPQLANISSGIYAMNELDRAQREWEMVEEWIPRIRELRLQERRSCGSGRDSEMWQSLNEADGV
ncbi:hypothetical protein BDN72DRAFT_131666 [Pluteus cervinus]|uniref:Uncharacterized protein n=1 Tax=Pluteus cervinus TaxID=181527 RepID=A0ACD3ALA4_9AGAR|nr:hypothetical protein BDN72DRAFT_131666 [Pluteus cervinus]